MKEETEQ